MMYSFQPQNNAVLSGMQKPMPKKDITSDGEASFSLNRRAYSETLPSSPEELSAVMHKKWMGNRDASRVAEKRRVREIGVGTFNAGGNSLAFMNKNDNNSRIDALARVRGGGYVPSPKIRNRPTSDGVPVLTPPVASPVVRSEFRRPMVPTPPHK
jgi:hypothetical protein